MRVSAARRYLRHNCYKKLVNETLEINIRYPLSHISRQKKLCEDIGGPPIPVPIVHDVKMNALLHIGRPPIRCSTPLTALRTLYCRNTKKPTKAKWLLGKEYKKEIDIECKGHVPWMAWRMSDKIKRWGITWRNSMPTNPDVSVDINGDLGLAIMMSHRMTLLALALVNGEMWPDALAALVVVRPVRPGDGDDDYIAVVLDATLYHMELCARAQERGLPGRYYHASGERRAVIWRAVSNEKPIIVKNISYFRNYF